MTTNKSSNDKLALYHLGKLDQLEASPHSCSSLRKHGILKLDFGLDGLEWRIIRSLV